MVSDSGVDSEDDLRRERNMVIARNDWFLAKQTRQPLVHSLAYAS
jgi:hypothetical protein